MPKQLPWIQIEEQYVRGGKTLAELSSQWGVSRRTLQTHSAQGGWVEKRRRYEQLVALQRESLLEQVQLPPSERTAAHCAATRLVVEMAQAALERLKRELQTALDHDGAERGRDPGSAMTALTALTPLVETWVWILDKAVRLERELLALQYEHPAKAIQYLSQLGYEVRENPRATAK